MCGTGFVVNVRGERSHAIVEQGLEVLRRLAHRGAVGADPRTGDGAGLLVQLPQEFLTKVCAAAGIELPRAGSYGAGLVFFPPDQKEQKLCREIFRRVIASEGQQLLGWRPVPVDPSVIGDAARETQPRFEQLFIAKGQKINTRLELERRLYVIRKRVEHEVRRAGLKQSSFFYITNLSTRTLAYKGLLTPDQVGRFFPDLQDPDLRSAICLVHSRYSTNTFPTWDLAQPFRFLAHNGEINTLRGNINWMRAREGQLASRLFGADIEQLKPVVVPGGSDSAALDNVFELLVLAGRSLPHAMMMLVPGAWERNKRLSKEVRDFYQYHACLMEPWDGPAAVAFTDGRHVGALLDRNGLRPARYLVTNDGLVVMASEVGVLEIASERVARSGRLEPGKMFYIDTETGRIVEDEEVRAEINERRFYGQWLNENLVDLEDLPAVSGTTSDPLDPLTLLKAYGYTREDLRVILKPMAEKGKEPVGSMGNDTPHAVLSDRPQLLYNYFRQLFAQVTNPAIDPIREELVMSLESYLGPQQNILEETPEHCRKLRVRSPVLTDQDLERIRQIRKHGFKTKTLSMLFSIGPDAKSVGSSSRKGTDSFTVGPFLHRIKELCREAEAAIKEGYTFLVLSDRGTSEKMAALPALLAVGAVHHHLVRQALRGRIALIVESAEPREVHHFALLFAYGAGLVNPYLAYQAIGQLVEQGDLTIDARTGINNYRHAVEQGLQKVLSKMGISTLNSYRGAQIFEALGIGPEVIKKCFEGTASRIGGAGFAELARETVLRHMQAFSPDAKSVGSSSRKGTDSFTVGTMLLDSGGLYQWRRDGEFHFWNPESINAIQQACWNNDREKFCLFSRLIDDQRGRPTTLRGLFKFKKGPAVPLNEVEPAEQILKRFATGAMSFGSISGPAHETLAKAMNQIGGRSNTGEGGEDPARFKDDRRSAVKQVASGRFGVTANYLVNADELQIKIAQGAKPGEGGQLPGHKVSAIIAKTRYTTPGVTLISPPPHHDIYSIEDLAQLIFDLKNVNPRARISVKLVSEAGVGTVAAGVAKGHADMILIAGHDGGTGASPLSSIRHAGLPWELGLAETHQTLMQNGLRSRVRLQTDGQLRTARDLAVAALLGAEEYGFATIALIIGGCVMLRHCHLNNCSVGVATQDEELAARFRGKPEYLVNYFRMLAEELRALMAELGFRSLDEMIGRSDRLELDQSILPWKAKKLDASRILYQPGVLDPCFCTIAQDHGLEKVLDRQLIKLARAALEKGEPVSRDLPISNSDRTTGAMLSGELVRRYGEKGLPDKTIRFHFTGQAGQSFGAWLAPGITFELEGLANDYVGKGISGGRIIIRPHHLATYRAEDNIVIGNTTFYGAIGGEAFIRGRAGERFCIRNSGLNAVVEGVGDHACEYMTGGRVVVIGPTGRNFAAGMSGGIAYVHDPHGEFPENCNRAMVELEELTPADAKLVRRLLNAHFQATRSPVAKALLDNFAEEQRRFAKVMPREYKRVLAEQPPTEQQIDEQETLDG